MNTVLLHVAFYVGDTLKQVPKFQNKKGKKTIIDFLAFYQKNMFFSISTKHILDTAFCLSTLYSIVKRINSLTRMNGIKCGFLDQATFVHRPIPEEGSNQRSLIFRLNVASIIHSAGVLAADDIIFLIATCKADRQKIYLKYYIIIPMIRVLQQI